MPHTPPSQHLTAAAVCEEFGCDRSTLSRWVKEGFIEPAYKFPGERGAFLFDEQDVRRIRTEARERIAKKRGAA